MLLKQVLKNKSWYKNSFLNCWISKYLWFMNVWNGNLKLGLGIGTLTWQLRIKWLNQLTLQTILQLLSLVWCCSWQFPRVGAEGCDQSCQAVRDKWCRPSNLTVTMIIFLHAPVTGPAGRGSSYSKNEKSSSWNCQGRSRWDFPLGPYWARNN